jgi:thiol-disulfide isomerase/thioredoxin
VAEPPPVPPPGVVELKDVKYNGLVEAVKAHRGKVVLVDVWATTCVPCIANYPHMLEMQKKYGADGLVCISVSIDPAKSRAAVQSFLTRKESTITNFWLDEPVDVWAKRWDVNGPPVVFIFDRAGRRAGKFGTEENPARVMDGKEDKPNPDMEKLVKELLTAKP